MIGPLVLKERMAAMCHIRAAPATPGERCRLRRHAGARRPCRKSRPAHGRMRSRLSSRSGPIGRRMAEPMRTRPGASAMEQCQPGTVCCAKLPWPPSSGSPPQPAEPGGAALEKTRLLKSSGQSGLPPAFRSTNPRTSSPKQHVTHFQAWPGAGCPGQFKEHHILRPRWP